MLSPPRLTREQLLEKVVNAIHESGWEVKVLSEEHPFQLLILRDDGTSQRIRVYIWNITHGGKNRAADEYRIQITGVSSIETGTDYRTLLIGWDDRHHVFAGWNPTRYETFGASPSLQIKDGMLVKAATQGMAVQPKEVDTNGNVTEVVVAFKPELFGVYVDNLDKYHQPKLTPREADLLAKVASPSPPTDIELGSLSEERRHVIREVEQAVRRGKFRKLVIEAYDHRCAICDIDLGIVHAAHIVPVEEKGTDDPNNGIGLCANHHAAFDRDILVIKEDYVVTVNPKLIKDKLPEAQKLLENETKIRIPSEGRLRPSPDNLRKRLQQRGIWFT